jgi:hypothetical protein
MEDLKKLYDEAEQEARHSATLDVDTSKIDPINPGFLDPGTYEVEELIPGSKDTLPARKFDPKATLTDICKDYVLFSHATILLFGGLPFDPVQQFYISRNISDPPIGLGLDDPIFTGHEVIQEEGKFFNQFLFAVPKEIWPDLMRHLGSLTICNREIKFYGDFVPQNLPLLDRVTLNKHSTLPDELPKVRVYVFALDANVICMHYVPPEDPLKDLIHLKLDIPNLKVIQAADMIFEKSLPKKG